MQCAIYCAFWGGKGGGGHTDVVKVSKTQKENSCMYVLGIKGEMYDLR